MSEHPQYSFTRYLSAKKSVDDRSLNLHVWRHFAETLTAHQSGPFARRVRMLELGAGIGTMVQRLLENSLLEDVHYTAIDASASNIQAASILLPPWFARHGFDVSPSSPQVAATPPGFRLNLLRPESYDRSACSIFLDLAAVDLFDFLDSATHQDGYDFLIAHAFMDLVDVAQVLDELKQVLQPRALLYLTINFDGDTILEPAISHQLDSQILDLYHKTMDQRMINGALSGDSRTGRHLFAHLGGSGYEVVDSGGSDLGSLPFGSGLSGRRGVFPPLHHQYNQHVSGWPSTTRPGGFSGMDPKAARPGTKTRIGLYCAPARFSGKAGDLVQRN